ncbi:MAG: hypothetical protein H8E90_04975 [Anaerolineales bacterium]|nr:hypothetical protein [Anaerolineales bacterium]
MTEERNTTAKTKEKPKEPAATERTGVGGSPVGPIGIVLITAYLILVSVLLLYSLIQLWPPPIPAGESAPTSSPATLLFWTFPVSDEVRLIFIIALAGALGSLVHALRSLYWYIGNRDLVRSWLAKYILLPFVGSTLALVFYFVVRGGLFSPSATIQETSPFGFAALAGLVGMFSDQAAEKLREVAATLLAPTPKGEDHVAPKTAEESEDKDKDKPKPKEEG